MSDDWQPPDAEYALTLPFVCTRSHGGPYDDISFVAGFQAGLLDQMLADGPARVDGVLVYSEAHRPG